MSRPHSDIKCRKSSTSSIYLYSSVIRMGAFNVVESLYREDVFLRNPWFSVNVYTNYSYII